MNGYYNGFPPQPMGYMPQQQMQMQMQPQPPPYAPTSMPPMELGFNPNFWAYMAVKQRGKTYTDQDWKLLVETLAKCDSTEYFMEVKGISMSSHVWFKDSYYRNKMVATQSAYGPDHLVTLFNVEIKSSDPEVGPNVPELEIQHVKDRNTPDVIWDTLSYHFIDEAVITNIRIGERQPREQTMTVYARFEPWYRYLEAFLPHFKNLKYWIDPTNIRIKGIPSGGRGIFDAACEFILGRWGKIFDSRFKDRPEGCECYVRVRLPDIAEDIRRFDWRDPDVPLELHNITTNTPSYALWGAAGKPDGAFVFRDLTKTGFIQTPDLQALRAQLQHHYEHDLKFRPHPVHNPEAYQIAKANQFSMGYAQPMMGNATPFPMGGNATPFPMGNATPFHTAGNATPFPNVGNATPFPGMGNATPHNAFNTYAATPFNSFTLDNQASTSFDPRFPVPMMDDGMPEQDMPVDQSFSRRAQANSKKPQTTARGNYASRGKTRGAPVHAGRRDSRNDRNDAHDPAGGDGDHDRHETGSQKSNQSRKSGSTKGKPPAGPRSDRSNGNSQRTHYHLFPWTKDEPDEKARMEEELAGFRRAYTNSTAWNATAEARQRRQELEEIIQQEIDARTERRRALYESLNADDEQEGQNGGGLEIPAENGQALS